MASALAEILGKGKKMGPMMESDSEDEAETVDSVADACKTLFPKLDSREAAATVRRMFAALKDEDTETDEDEEE